MSLRTKMAVSVVVFLALVFGLLTLNLWLDAAGRARAEGQRNADLVARMVSDLVRGWTARFPVWDDEAWAELGQRLGHAETLQRWTIAGRRADRLQVMISNEKDPDRILAEEGDRFRAAFDGVSVDPGGARLFMPLFGPQGELYAARLDVRGAAVPSADIAVAFRGILTVMVLGAVLLLLITTVLIHRLVLRPLDGLVEASARAAKGDFSKKIPENGAYDEMGRLVAAFNLMIDRIGDSHRRLQDDIAQARGRVTQTERRLLTAQRLSTTGTLAAGIAHEINNPLGGMINAARSLRDGRLDAAKQAEYLELMVDGLERVRAIVQKILQFRPRAFEPRPVELREAVEKATAFLEHRARAKEVAVRNELPPGLPSVNGDPLELQQAFLNILMNAVDACVMGEGMITVYGRREGDAVQVSVADNGCGMEPEELARCLDPFFTTKDVGEGTGLGLAVAHNIVTGHGGRIDLSSERGRGTTVTLTLPVARGAAVAG